MSTRPTPHSPSLPLPPSLCPRPACSSLKSYKSQLCPHGSKCRSKAFCPHVHILGSPNDIASAVAAAAAAAAGGGGGGGSGGIARRCRDDKTTAMSSGSGGVMSVRRFSSSPSRPCSLDAGDNSYGAGGGGREAEGEWQTVARRGRRAPSPAGSEAQVSVA